MLVRGLATVGCKQILYPSFWQTFDELLPIPLSAVMQSMGCHRALRCPFLPDQNSLLTVPRH
jgi:hypothetical protein